MTAGVDIEVTYTLTATGWQVLIENGITRARMEGIPNRRLAKRMVAQIIADWHTGRVVHVRKANTKRP